MKKILPIAFRLAHAQTESTVNIFDTKVMAFSDATSSKNIIRRVVLNGGSRI